MTSNNTTHMPKRLMNSQILIAPTQYNQLRSSATTINYVLKPQTTKPPILLEVNHKAQKLSLRRQTNINTPPHQKHKQQTMAANAKHTTPYQKHKKQHTTTPKIHNYCRKTPATHHHTKSERDKQPPLAT